MEKKILGILGGMGSQAGASLLQKVLDLTPAQRDQDHLEILLYSNPRIPDRTRSILGSGPPAEPELVRSVRLLESAGVQCIIIACVTSHHYIEALRSSVRLPIFSIVEETTRHLTLEHPGRARVGLLATTGTIRAAFIQQEFQQHSLEVLTPDKTDQERLVMGAVYGDQGIKAGFLDAANRDKLYRAAERLVDQGADILVAGCTEIPLVLSAEVHGIPLVDMIDPLVSRAVAFCRGSV